jgi:hypothetical protein
MNGADVRFLEMLDCLGDAGDHRPSADRWRRPELLPIRSFAPAAFR